MPTKYSLRPASGRRSSAVRRAIISLRRATSSAALGRIGPGERASRSASPRAALARRAAPRRARAPARPRRPGRRSRRRRQRSTGRSSVWWSAVAYGYGTRIAGCPAAASSHTVPPARDTATSAAASSSPKWSVCGSSTYPSRSTRARSSSKSRSPETCRTTGPRSPHAETASSLSERAPASAPKTATTGASSGRPKRARPSSRVAPRCALGDRAPDDLVLRPPPARDRVGEVDRRREAARRAGSRARGGRRPPSAPPGCAVGARPPPSARRRSRRRRGRRRAAAGRGSAGRPRGAHRRERAPSPSCRDGRRGKSGDLERVELEARLRHQPRLDAVCRPGERHGRSACAQRLRDRESGPDVTCRSPGRDHAHELRRRAH